RRELSLARLGSQDAGHVEIDACAIHAKSLDYSLILSSPELCGLSGRFRDLRFWRNREPVCTTAPGEVPASPGRLAHIGSSAVSVAGLVSSIGPFPSDG